MRIEGSNSMALNNRLIVVSNRVPPASGFESQGRGEASAGGLVTAVRAAMEQTGGLWFGWSGRSTRRRVTTGPTVRVFDRIQLATMDLSDDEVSLFYLGFSNRTLWPLLHSFPTRVVIRHDTYRAYRRINLRFAQALMPLLRSDDLIWVQDFHLFHLGYELRRLGWRGKLGFFLHVPFPPAEIFNIMPWASDVLSSLLQYDLVGVHDARYLHNLIDALGLEFGGDWNGEYYSCRDHSVRLGVFPIGIDPDTFRPREYGHQHNLSDELGLATVPDRRLILGVDRLDYTKGIPHRLRIFERLLERHPSLGGKLIYIQVSSPSRTRVPEYVQEKEQVERLVGQINGRFSEAGWVPIRYLYRSYSQAELAGFYHETDVCLVTPLRDGMNLVAKEFVAAQDVDSPGVLVLSRFTGAASTMKDAVIVNPYDIDGTAESTYQALRMPLSERRRRNRSLLSVVERYSSRSWSDSFCATLQDI